MFGIFDWFGPEDSTEDNSGLPALTGNKPEPDNDAGLPALTGDEPEPDNNAGLLGWFFND